MFIIYMIMHFLIYLKLKSKPFISIIINVILIPYSKNYIVVQNININNVKIKFLVLNCEKVGEKCG